MNRWRWMLVLGFVGSLIACGRSQGAFIPVYPSPAQPRPTLTPYQPIRQDTALIVDLPMAAVHSTVFITMDSSQTLQFTSSLTDRPLEWRIKFDPLVWDATAQGIPIVSDGVMQADPPATIRLIPRAHGITTMRIDLSYRLCPGCDTMLDETRYEITIQ